MKTPLERIQNILSEIDAREKAATPGPWGTDKYSTYDELHVTGVKSVIHGCIGPPTFLFDTDAEFIAHARTDIPRLKKTLNIAAEALHAVRHLNDLDPKLPYNGAYQSVLGPGISEKALHEIANILEGKNTEGETTR